MSELEIFVELPAHLADLDTTETTVFMPETTPESEQYDSNDPQTYWLAGSVVVRAILLTAFAHRMRPH